MQQSKEYPAAGRNLLGLWSNSSCGSLLQLTGAGAQDSQDSAYRAMSLQGSQLVGLTAHIEVERALYLKRPVTSDQALLNLSSYNLDYVPYVSEMWRWWYLRCEEVWSGV